MTRRRDKLTPQQEELVMLLAQRSPGNEPEFVCAFFVSSSGLLFARYRGAIPESVFEPAAIAFEKALPADDAWMGRPV